MKKHGIGIILLFALISFPPKGLHALPYSNTAIADQENNEDSVKTTKAKNYTLTTRGISYKYIECYLDSGYYPRSLYYNLRVAEMTGVDLQDAMHGKVVVELYDDHNNKMPLVKEPKWYAAKTFKEGPQINILVNIPLNPQDKDNKKYSYQMIFTTSSGRNIISIKGNVK